MTTPGWYAKGATGATGDRGPIGPAGALNTTSPMVRALRDTPVAAGLTVTAQTGNNSPGTATSTVTGTLVTPTWRASTFYPSGAQVLKVSDGVTVLQRISGGTSRSSFDTTEQASWTSLSQGAQVTYPMRYNCGFIRKRTLVGQDVFGQRGPKYTDNSQDSDYVPLPWSVDFDWYTTGGAMEVCAFDQTAVRFVIDGQYATAAQTQFTGASDYNFRFIKLSGVAAGYHRVRIELGSTWSSIAGVKIATADMVAPTSIPATKKFAVIDDSYGVGFTDANAVNVSIGNYVTQLAIMLGFTNLINSSQATTGFTTPTTQKYAPRIDDMVAVSPDYLLIHGSANDIANVSTTLASAAQALYTDAFTRLPDTEIVACGATSFQDVSNSNSITAVLKTAWAAAGGDPAMFIDTTNWPNTTAGFIGPDGNHPTLTGHKYLASRLAPELASRWNLPL